MTTMKPIKPDMDKQKRKIIESVERQTKEGFEKQVNDRLRDVRCPVHGVRPAVRLDAVDWSQRQSELSYMVQDPCCPKLKDEVESELGRTIPLDWA